MPLKNEEEDYEKIIEMSKNNDYTTDNLLDFAYFKENYRLTAIDLSKQTKLKDPQQINFIGKLEGWYDGASMLFINEKSEETTFEFLRNSVNILQKWKCKKILNFLNSSENEYSNLQQKNSTLMTQKSNKVFNKVNRIKSLSLFWCIRFSYRKYCCYRRQCKYKSSI